jgi:hypothetical protein
MATLTLRYLKGYFVVNGADMKPTRFRSRREARDWCHTQHPGSPIHEIGADRVKRAVRPTRKAEWDRNYR